jgi:hypothetical protein
MCFAFRLCPADTGCECGAGRRGRMGTRAHPRPAEAGSMLASATRLTTEAQQTHFHGLSPRTAKRCRGPRTLHRLRIHDGYSAGHSLIDGNWQEGGDAHGEALLCKCNK